MSKNKLIPAGENGENIAQFPSWRISHLEGVLLTIIESVGLQNKQEDAIKSLVKNAIWDEWLNADKIFKEWTRLPIGGSLK